MSKYLIESVFCSCYDVKKPELCTLLISILETKQLAVEQADKCYKAIKLYKQGNADFSDALISTISNDAGCTKTVTFDRKAISVGMSLATLKQD